MGINRSELKEGRSMRYSIKIGLPIAAVLAATAWRSPPSTPYRSPCPSIPATSFLRAKTLLSMRPGAANDDAWQAVDYDGKIVAEGHGSGRIALGQLPVGYYELRGQERRSGPGEPCFVGRACPVESPHAAHVAHRVRRRRGVVLSHREDAGRGQPVPHWPG